MVFIVKYAAKDMSRAWSALNSLIPTTTGTATAITLIYPELKGKLKGHAVSVPLLNALLMDCFFEVDRATTADEVNALFKAAAAGPLDGIWGCEERALAATDDTNDSRSSSVKTPSMMVGNGTRVEVHAWPDHPLGYAQRVIDVAHMIGGRLS